jgi:hypothetical protein
MERFYTQLSLGFEVVAGTYDITSNWSLGTTNDSLRR